MGSEVSGRAPGLASLRASPVPGGCSGRGLGLSWAGAPSRWPAWRSPFAAPRRLVGADSRHVGETPTGPDPACREASGLSGWGRPLRPAQRTLWGGWEGSRGRPSPVPWGERRPPSSPRPALSPPAPQATGPAGTGMQLLETEFSRTVPELIELHLLRQDSIPAFLSALTLDLFSRQTLA